jgi:hypothetical protein
MKKNNRQARRLILSNHLAENIGGGPDQSATPGAKKDQSELVWKHYPKEIIECSTAGIDLKKAARRIDKP